MQAREFMVPSKNFIIAISGGSGSGKTTFSKKLEEFLGKETCVFIGLDNYYKDQSEKFNQNKESVNFDHPDSIDFDLLYEHLQSLKNNHEIIIPTYDFVTHKRIVDSTQSKNHIVPKPIIILDGILTLTQDKLHSLIDYSIYLDIDSKTRFNRRLERDVQHRGRSVECVIKQFNEQVFPMHEQFVEPSKKKANIIFENNQEAFEHLEELKKIALDKLCQNYQK